jgi:hypothetical protein
MLQRSLTQSSPLRVATMPVSESFMGFPEKDLKGLIKGLALATEEQVKGVKTKPKQGGWSI